MNQFAVLYRCVFYQCAQHVIPMGHQLSWSNPAVFQPHLSGSQDDGGELWAVPPLRQEGESEGLDEDGRDDSAPAPLGHGGGARLHVWAAVDQLRALKLRGCGEETANQWRDTSWRHIDWCYGYFHLRHRCWNWPLVLRICGYPSTEQLIIRVSMQT